jgi:phage baseplate assembly protein V
LTSFRNSVTDPIQRQLNTLKARLALMASRVILRLIDDSDELMIAQVDGLADETHEAQEIMTAYGLRVRPLPGAEGIMISVAGARSNGVVIATVDRRYRIELQPGEVAVHDDQGQKLHLMRDGVRIESPFKVEVAAPEVNVTANSSTIDADSVEFTGAVSIGGNLSVGGDMTLTGDATLGDGASLFVKLSDNSNATKVKAL